MFLQEWLYIFYFIFVGNILLVCFYLCGILCLVLSVCFYLCGVLCLVLSVFLPLWHSVSGTFCMFLPLWRSLSGTFCVSTSVVFCVWYILHVSKEAALCYQDHQVSKSMILQQLSNSSSRLLTALQPVKDQKIQPYCFFPFVFVCNLLPLSEVKSI
jgi:hypothetical protein